MRPSCFAYGSVNQTAPSEPAVMVWGTGEKIGPSWLADAGTRYSVIAPEVVTRPILLVNDSTNHNAPSGPTAIAEGWLVAVGMGYSVMLADVVILPILSPSVSVNQIAPSGPATIPPGWALNVGIGYSVMTPDVVIRPILVPYCSVNQTAPSGPDAMPQGLVSDVGTVYSVTTPAVVIRAILLLNVSTYHNAPSGPEVMLKSEPLASGGTGYSVRLPAVVIRPISAQAVNQSAPSGPVTIAPAPKPDIAYSVTDNVCADRIVKELSHNPTMPVVTASLLIRLLLYISGCEQYIENSQLNIDKL